MRNKSYIYFYFISLFLLNVILRYPILPYQTGRDTFSANYRTDLVTEYGFLPWYLSPLSFFGIFPFSYPSGVMLLMSALNQITGLQIQSLIYVYSLIIGLLGMFSFFILSKSLYSNINVSLISTTLFSTSYIYVLWTYWRMSPRGLFLVIFLTFLWFMLSKKKNSSENTKHLTIGFVVLLCLFVIHRMSLAIFPLIVFPFLFYNLFSVYMSKYPNLKYDFKTNKILNICLLLIYVIGLLLVISFDSFRLMDNKGYYYEIFSEEGLFFFTIANLAITFFKMHGFMSVFYPIAIIGTFLSHKRENNFLKLFFIFSIPFIFDSSYFILIMSIFTSLAIASCLFSYSSFLKRYIIFSLFILLLFSSLFTHNFLQNQDFISSSISIFSMILLLCSVYYYSLSKKKTFSLRVSIICFILLTSSFQIHKNLETERIYLEEDSSSELSASGNTIPYSTFNAAMWVKLVGVKNISDNGESLSHVVNAITGTSRDPLFRNYISANDEVYSSYVRGSINVSLDKLLTNPRHLYDTESPLPAIPYGQTPATYYIFGLNDQKVAKFWNISYIIEDKASYGKWRTNQPDSTINSDERGFSESSFLSSLHQNRYKVFENRVLTIHYYDK